MKQEFIDYLEEVGITGALLDKALETYIYYTKYLNVEVEDIFVSEYINPDGSRTYENLWFFNNVYCFEAKQFIVSEDYDMDFFRDVIFSFNIVKKDFDIANLLFTDNSRMTLTFYLNAVRAGVIKASKSNCKKLAEINKKYIITNLKK